MLQIFLLFLPCSVCLVALPTFALKLHKLSSDAICIALCAFAAYYFFIDAYMVYPLHSLSELRILAIIIAKGCSLCLFPLTYLWLRRISDLPKPGWWFSLLFVLPIVIVILLLALFVGMHPDVATQYLWETFYSEHPLDRHALSGIFVWHFYIAYVTYHALIGAEAIAMIIIVACRIRAHYRNQEWSARDMYIVRMDFALLVMTIIMLIRIVMGPKLLMEHSIISVSLSTLLAMSLYVLLAAAIYMGIIDNPAINKETYRSVQQARQSALRNDFERLMNEQRPYLKQGLTIEDVALMLATNRTYVSQMLHDDYGCTFPEYMTEQRLKFSKQFLLEHPHEVQEEVAFQSGFANASAFNKKFREFYGQTPREWLITTRKENQNT